jgi:hypothetical protein
VKFKEKGLTTFNIYIMYIVIYPEHYFYSESNEKNYNNTCGV